jgi:hypothetical protein
MPRSGNANSINIASHHRLGKGVASTARRLPRDIFELAGYKPFKERVNTIVIEQMSRPDPN